MGKYALFHTEIFGPVEDQLRGFCPTPQKGSIQSGLETLLPQSGIRQPFIDLG